MLIYVFSFSQVLLPIESGEVRCIFLSVTAPFSPFRCSDPVRIGKMYAFSTRAGSYIPPRLQIMQDSGGINTHIYHYTTNFGFFKEFFKISLKTCINDKLHACSAGFFL